PSVSYQPFFFQAEDGIRDFHVTGVQTCALPISSGIYRYTRNPMYLGFLLILAGYGVWLANLPALLWLIGYVLYLTRFQIIPEERWLSQKFGADFQYYRERVRRWF